MTTEIQEKLDKVGEGIKAIQSKVDNCNGRIDAITDEEIKKISDNVATQLETVQKMETKQEALEVQNKRLEELICNQGGHSGSDLKKMEENARDDFTNLLRRKKTSLDKDTVEYICKSLVEQAYIAIPSEKKAVFTKDLQVQVNPQGGYWVRPEFLNTVITRVFETSKLRPFATVITTTGDAVEMPIDDQEPDCEWVGETESGSETNTPNIGVKFIYVKTLKAKPRITEQLLEDSGFDVEGWLRGKVSDAFSRKENRAFVVGDGSKEPKGFLTYDPWTVQGVYERGKIEQRISSTIGSFEADDLKDLQTDLLEDYVAGSIWTMQRKTFNIVSKLKDGEDRYLLDTESLKTGDTKILLGGPIAFMADMQAVANDSLPIAYGNFRVGYMIVDRLGIKVKVDNLTADPFVKFITKKRVGGDVISYDALKILKIKSS